MQKPGPYFLLCLLFSGSLFAQKVSGNIHFEPGQILLVKMDIKNSITQQAASQAIPFSVEGSVTHSYKVIAATTANGTLHHELLQLKYKFNGMGQTRSFDSDAKKDLQSAAGKQLEEIISKKYNIVIDSSGSILLTEPATINRIEQDDKMIILSDMISELTAVAYPPAKENDDFFKIFPGYEVGIGDSWTDSTYTENKKSITINTLSAITDSTLVVDFKTTATTRKKSEMMGVEATTNMNNTSIGKIIVDKETGLVREKMIVTDSNGSTMAMNSSLPITGKTIVTIHVSQQ